MRYAGGFGLNELFAASITTLDIIVVYVLLEVKEGKFALAIWTAFLNMLLPFLGFMTGEFSASFFSGFSDLLSGVLLGLIGLHMLLEDDDGENIITKITPGTHCICCKYRCILSKCFVRHAAFE